MASYKPVGIDEAGLLPPRAMGAFDERYFTTASIEDPNSDPRNVIRQVVAEDYNEYSIDMYPGVDDTEKLQAAIDDATANKEDRIVVIPRSINIERMIRWDIGYASLRFGRGIVHSMVESGPTFTVHNTRSGLTANTNKSLEMLELRGPGKDTPTVAFEFHSPSPTYPGNSRGLSFYNAEVRGFGTIYRLQDNAYLLTFINTHCWSYDVGVHMPAGYANYGENIRFIGGNFGSGRLAALNENADGDIYFIGASIDFVEKFAEAQEGIINFDSCHIEMRHSDVSAPVATTHGNRAQVLVSGGRLMFHGTSPNTDYVFLTENTPWGMGIVLSDVELFNVDSTTHILCGGTGNIKTRGLQTSSSGGGGYSVEAVIPSKAQNRLIDPTFGAQFDNYSKVRDAYVRDGSSRVVSADIQLTQIAPGRLVAHRKFDSTGYDTVFEVIVPLTGDLNTEWASGFRITAAPSSGSFAFTEGFVAVEGYDSVGIPQFSRTDMRSTSTIDLSNISSYPYQRVYGYTAFDRHERPWATHFRTLFNIRDIGAGATMNFRDIFMACR